MVDFNNNPTNQNNQVRRNPNRNARPDQFNSFQLSNASTPPRRSQNNNVDLANATPATAARSEQPRMSAAQNNSLRTPQADNVGQGDYGHNTPEPTQNNAHAPRIQQQRRFNAIQARQGDGVSQVLNFGTAPVPDFQQLDTPTLNWVQRIVEINQSLLQGNEQLIQQLIDRQVQAPLTPPQRASLPIGTQELQLFVSLLQHAPDPNEELEAHLQFATQRIWNRLPTTEQRFDSSDTCPISLNALPDIENPACIHNQVYELKELLRAVQLNGKVPHNRQPFTLADVQKVEVSSEQAEPPTKKRALDAMTDRK